MASRTWKMSIEDGGFITEGEGYYVQYDPYTGDYSAFGNNTPTYISFEFDSSQLYANYSNSVTMEYSLRIKINGTWYKCYEGSSRMSKSDSNFSQYYIYIPNISGLQSALKNYTIEKIGVYQEGSRVIRGVAGSYAYVTIDYDEVIYTNVGTPSNVKINGSTSLVNTTASTVTLSWSAASAGTNNPVAGYFIQYSNSSNGSSWDGWWEGGSTTSTSITINAPDVGKYRKYKVWALGSASGYDSSSGAESPLVYRQAITACTAPTSVSVASTNVAPGASVTLSWSGAGAGSANAITGYHIYRSTSASGTYQYLAAVTTSSTSGSATVTAPTTNGSSYYYKVYTIGSVSGYNSGASGNYATLTCSYSTPSAPTSITINGGSSAYATSGVSVTLAWSGASAGTNNPIAGYIVYRDGTAYQETTGTSMSVPAHTTAGNSYTYTVYTKGTYSNSGASNSAKVYTYSAPTAPTSISVSNSTPEAGGTFTLSWSGAGAGSYNAISAYHIYRASSSNGTYTHLETVTTSAAAASVTVYAPNNMGSSYYYKVYTIGARGLSSDSSSVASVTTKSYAACTAPSSVSLNVTSSSGANVTLSWSGAIGGTGNAIVDYEIQYRSKSSSAASWGSWTALSTSTETSISVSPPPTAGHYYHYRVRTRGTAGSNYYSGWTESSNTLYRSITSCGAPTACAVSSTLSDEAVTLHWSGATSGYGNTITGYDVQRCESSNGSTWGSWSTISSPTSTSISVSPPEIYGNYYKYRVRAKGSAGSSYYSGWKESTNTLRRGHAPVGAFTDPVLSASVTPIRAIHMTEMQERVNELLEFYGHDTVTFTNIIAGTTPLSSWTTHVNEIRNAIDQIGSSHEAWISFTTNCPRADVIMQMREIISAL